MDDSQIWLVVYTAGIASGASSAAAASWADIGIEDYRKRFGYGEEEADEG